MITKTNIFQQTQNLCPAASGGSTNHKILKMTYQEAKVGFHRGETLLWGTLTDYLDYPDEADPGNQVASTTVRDLTSTRAGGQDDVSSKQTPSNKSYIYIYIYEI